MCNYPYLLHTLSHVYDRKFETTTAVKHRGINAVQCAPYRHCGHISKEPSKGHAEKNISRPHEIKFRSHELHGECRGLITESLEIIFTDMRQKRDSQQPRYTHHLRLPKKTGTATSPLFGPCLLWPNGWMDQDATWYGGLGPGHILRCGPSSPLPRKGAQ